MVNAWNGIIPRYRIRLGKAADLISRRVRLERSVKSLGVDIPALGPYQLPHQVSKVNSLWPIE